MNELLIFGLAALYIVSQSIRKGDNTWIWDVGWCLKQLRLQEVIEELETLWKLDVHHEKNFEQNVGGVNNCCVQRKRDHFTVHRHDEGFTSLHIYKVRLNRGANHFDFSCTPDYYYLVPPGTTRYYLLLPSTTWYYLSTTWYYLSTTWY